MDRRDFLKKGCFACMAVAGTTAVSGLLASCSPLPNQTAMLKGTTLLLEKTKFPGEENVLLLKTEKLENNILLVRCKEGRMHALYMQCTHNNNPLSPTRSQIFCNSHNAEFDLEGNVKAGPPKKGLRRFEVTEDNNFYIVHLNTEKKDCKG